MRLSEFEYENIQIKGYSEGGIRTSIIWPTLNLMFDMGSTFPGQIQYQNLLLTHSHLDHFAGLPYYISQRSLQRLPAPNVFVPEEIGDKVKKLLDLYSELEDFEYKYSLFPVKPGDRFTLNKNHFCIPHKSFHRVPSQGYTVYETRTKLKAEFRDLSPEEIKIKKETQEITEKVDTPVLSFSGDSKIEYVLENPDVRKAKILFLECTYLDETRDVARAREWGHIHLQEIAEHSSVFENERLVLIHFSQRYSFGEIRDLITKTLPKGLLDRVHLFLPHKNSTKKDKS
jgi:ribonuclease Z